MVPVRDQLFQVFNADGKEGDILERGLKEDNAGSGQLQILRCSRFSVHGDTTRPNGSGTAVFKNTKESEGGNEIGTKRNALHTEVLEYHVLILNLLNLFKKVQIGKRKRKEKLER